MAKFSDKEAREIVLKFMDCVNKRLSDISTKHKSPASKKKALDAFQKEIGELLGTEDASEDDEGKAEAVAQTTNLAMCQIWIESERGWGQRPDGFSLHLTSKDRDDYIKEYTDEALRHIGTSANRDYVPDVYVRAEGEPFLVMIDEETHKKLRSKKSLRYSERDPIPKRASL